MSSNLFAHYPVGSISGHRFGRIRGTSYKSGEIKPLRDEMMRQMIFLYENCGTRIWLDGFAEGTDLLGVSVIDELQQKGYDIKLYACIPLPYHRQTRKFSNNSMDVYSRGLEIADKVIHTYEMNEYSGRNARECLLNRNKMMLDFSQISLMVFNFAEDGGTRHYYNRTMNRDSVVIDLNVLYGIDYRLGTHSRGDKRFSPLCVPLTINGKTKLIEDWYQSSKIVPNPDEDHKGQKPKGFIFNGIRLDKDEQGTFFDMLWVLHFIQYPLKYRDLFKYDEYIDMFSHSSKVNQGDTITRIVRQGLAKSFIDISGMIAKLNIDIDANNVMTNLNKLEEKE